MRSPLRLTSTEQRAFQALSSSLREGWVVEAETLTYQDSVEKRSVRLALMRFHDPKILALRERAEKATSKSELLDIVRSVDLSRVNDADMAELFFALGPDPLTTYMEELLKVAKTDTHLELIAALSDLRYAFLSSFAAQ